VGGNSNTLKTLKFLKIFARDLTSQGPSRQRYHHKTSKKRDKTSDVA